jgi:hypothetical protein
MNGNSSSKNGARGLFREFLIVVVSVGGYAKPEPKWGAY